MSEIHVRCGQCGHTMVKPSSMAGGMFNCDDCGALIELKGAADSALYWGIVIAIALVLFAVAGGAMTFGNVPMAMGAIALALLIVLIFALAG